MSTIVRLALASVALLVACDGGVDPKEAKLQEAVALMNRMADSLEGVEGEASAKAAVPELEAIVKDLKRVTDEGQKLGEPADELKEKYQPDLDAAQQRIQKAVGELEPAVAMIIARPLAQMR